MKSALLLAAVAFSANAAVPLECRMKPDARDPLSDPVLLQRMAADMLSAGSDRGLEYLQLASDAQREITIRENACAVCASAGFPDGSLQRNNCIADQVARNRPPVRPRPAETTTECKPDYIGGFTCRTR
jgi:hypothetical protein